MKNKSIVLLTWCSENHDPDVLKNVLSFYKGKRNNVEKVLYLYQPSEEGKLKDVETLGVPIEPILIEIDNPTVHRDIFDRIKNIVLPRVRDTQNLFINISPGTPAMHSVWLILFAGGYFPNGTKLISSQYSKKKEIPYVDDVDFPITTYLSEIHEYERKHPKEPTYGLDAKSPKRIAALEKIRAYASMKRRPMLLLGERGTGKSRLVEAIVSKIKECKKVVPVVCGSFALDPGMAESAIFGHMKGSFTGALTEKKGLIEEANEGILFLDEIQDLPKLVQRKLLRTLQDERHLYRKIGNDKEYSADIELVCASNLPEEELKERLDLDFYDRISFFKVKLPPLRECPEDLLDDWRKVWIAESSGLDEISKEVPNDECLLKFLKESQLPGNFRTLELVANHIIAWNGRKSMEDILKDISFEDVGKKNFNVTDFPEFENKSWQEATKFFHKALAKYACEKYKTQAAAAEALGCSSKTLQNSLKDGKKIKN